MDFKPMLQLGQNESIPFFQDFAAKYSDAMPEANTTFGYIEDSQPKDPFAINYNIVFFNQALWKRIGFSVEELEAMLTHEIGHYVDTLVRTENNQQEREEHADNYAIAHNLGGYLCSALMKCITSGLFSEQEVDGMEKRIIRIHFNCLNQCCYLLNGIHSEPKNKWLIAVYNHWNEIQNTQLNAERIRILEGIANQIDGIGSATIYETLTWFDDL